jgi:hypothetical protein
MKMIGMPAAVAAAIASLLTPQITAAGRFRTNTRGPSRDGTYQRSSHRVAMDKRAAKKVRNRKRG